MSEEGSSIRNLAADYANAVSQSEWATMARGMPSNTTTHALAHLTQAIFDLRADQLRNLALFQQGLRLLAVIEDNRNERLDNATGSVPSILWLALIGGGMITLAYPAFFGTSNLLAQTILTALLAGLVALILLPALLLDFPFTGHVAISPGAFETALQQMPPHPKEHPPTGATEN
jgi:hypothetical protein